MPSPARRASPPVLLVPLLLAILVSVTLGTSKGDVNRDAGLFLYEAQQILAGATPYRDIWDHKPPAVYYVNVLGLVISRDSLLGIWLVETISISIAAVLGYLALRRAFGRVPGIFGTAAWLLSSTLLFSGGNVAEEYALPFQFLALLLFVSSERRDGYRWSGLPMGVTLAACLLLKPNLVGIQLAIVLYLTMRGVASRRWLALASDLLAVFVGATSLLLVTTLYFAANGALGDLLDQVLRYNGAYISIKGDGLALERRITVLQRGLESLSPSGMATVGLAAWISGLLLAWRDGGRGREGDAMLRVALLALPLEFLLVALSGRGYRHYFLAWLPSLAVLASFFAHILLQAGGAPVKIGARGRTVSLGTLWVVALGIAMSVIPLLGVARGVRHWDFAGGELREVVGYVREATSPRDYVLVWGAESQVNFLSNRRSPTRFVYQYPLYTAGYHNGDMVKEFLGDIREKKPALIVDTSNANTSIPPIDAGKRAYWEKTVAVWSDFKSVLLPGTREVFEYVALNYAPVGPIGQQGWIVYRYRGEQGGG